MVVSILGCGWLGSALGEYLVANGYEVNGSATKHAKLNLIDELGMQGFLLEISETIALDSDSAFWNCDALIISSNVKLDGNEGYLKGMRAVAGIVRSKPIKRVLMVSSTSVYGEPNSVLDETALTQPETASAKRLVEIEAIFKDIADTQTTIIRCGGLVGPGRLPGSFLAGRKDVPNGLAPVNMVHLKDCIGLIQLLLQAEEPVQVLNAVAPDHPSRADFYTQAAAVQNLSLPLFVMEKINWKIVNSLGAEKLGYRYQISDWAEWLEKVRLENLNS